MIPFSYQMQDRGFCLINDIECELDCDVELIAGQPEVTVHTVHMHGYRVAGHRVDDKGRKQAIYETRMVDLGDTDSPTLIALAGDIMAAALADDSFIEAVCRDAGLVQRGQGGNDPYQRWEVA